MGIKQIIVSLLIVLPFLGLEMSPLSGSWYTSLGIWILFLIGLGIYHRRYVMRIGFRRPIFLKRAGKDKQRIEAKPIPSWLEQELSSDLQRISKAMRGRATRWDFSGIYNRERYFDVFVELTNTTIFTLSLRSLSGFMKIAGEPCTSPPQVSTRFGIKRDEPADIRVRQPITPETVAIIKDAGNSNKEIQFHLGEVVFEIKNDTSGYEQYKPYLTGGIHDIVPKDGLKLEPLRQNIGLMIIEGKEILVDLEKMNGQLDAAVRLRLS